MLGPVVGAIGGVAAALAIGLARGDRTHAGSIFVFDDLRTLARPADRAVRAARRLPACAKAAMPRRSSARSSQEMPCRRSASPVLCARSPTAPSDVEVDAATVRDALVELDRKHPGLATKLLDAAGTVKPFIRIYVGPDDIGALARPRHQASPSATRSRSSPRSQAARHA